MHDDDDRISAALPVAGKDRKEDERDDSLSDCLKKQFPIPRANQRYKAADVRRLVLLQSCTNDGTTRWTVGLN